MIDLIVGVPIKPQLITVYFFIVIFLNIVYYTDCFALKKVDQTQLWFTKSNSYDYTWDVLPNLGRFFGFFLICIIFFISIIIYLLKLIADVKAYRKRKLQGKAEYYGMGCLLRTQKNINKIINNNKIWKWYRKHFKVDSGLWCVKKISSEIFEVFIQTVALLYYNGYILFSSESNQVTLAYRPKYIKLFTIFLSINCIFACIIWLFYAFKPLICHGFIFSLVLYSMDVIFDFFYTLFPLIVVSQESPGFLVALGNLQTDDQLINLL